MKEIKRLDHLNMTVHNLKASIEWYERIFGFEVVEEGNRNGKSWAIIRSGEAMLCLYEHPERNFEVLFPESDLHGICHFAFRIQDEKRFREVIKEENLPLFFGGENDYPHSTSWYVKDPTGYSIEVVSWDGDEISFPA
jgi:catechol-2,3-dioxygenase